MSAAGLLMMRRSLIAQPLVVGCVRVGFLRDGRAPAFFGVLPRPVREHLFGVAHVSLQVRRHSPVSKRTDTPCHLGRTAHLTRDLATQMGELLHRLLTPATPAVENWSCGW